LTVLDFHIVKKKKLKIFEMRTEYACGIQIAHWEERREWKLLGNNSGMSGGHTAAI